MGGKILKQSHRIQICIGTYLSSYLGSTILVHYYLSILLLEFSYFFFLQKLPMPLTPLHLTPLPLRLIPLPLLSPYSPPLNSRLPACLPACLGTLQYPSTHPTNQPPQPNRDSGEAYTYELPISTKRGSFLSIFPFLKKAVESHVSHYFPPTFHPIGPELKILHVKNKAFAIIGITFDGKKPEKKKYNFPPPLKISLVSPSSSQPQPGNSPAPSRRPWPPRRYYRRRQQVLSWLLHSSLRFRYCSRLFPLRYPRVRIPALPSRQRCRG